VSKGQIVSQNPAAGSSVESGSSVDVTVSSGPKQMPVPNVVGSYINEAVQAVWNAGFGYTVETVQSNQPAGTVLSTDPPAGTLLDPYSRNVVIRQSSGPPPSPPTNEKSSDRASSKSDSNSKTSGKAEDGKGG